ncbi:hypothetical protein HMI54_010135 [Coelomomyces lativittatus]|nr:hypothetical protein HMI54_010135 [Coelomomyces lativittatus]
MDSSVQDLQVIKRDYLTSLVELKDTTKPIITNLTVIASEGIHVAPAFVAAIAERILDPKNFNKLPSLYLMDSILKNVGGVYIDLFSSLIVKLFSESFLNADDKTKKSMLKLLNTWRHPSPSSSFLPLSSSSSSASSSSTSTSSSAATTTSSRYIFPPSILTQLDSFVRSVPRPRHVILTESILNDLNTCIATKKTEHLYSTPDPQSLEQLSMLENLRTTIQSGQFPIETLELMKEKISSLSASMHLPSTSSSSSTTASISTTITSSANVNVSQIGLPLSTQTTLPPQLPTPPLPPSPSSSSSSSPLSSVASSTISATSISTATTSTSSTSSAIASFSPSTSSTSATVSPLPINSNTTSSSQVVFPSLPLFSTISSTLTASSSSTVHFLFLYLRLRSLLPFHIFLSLH